MQVYTRVAMSRPESRRAATTQNPSLIQLILAYGEGVHHIFVQHVLIELIGLGARLAIPVVAAVCVNQAVLGQMGWGFWAFTALLMTSWFYDALSDPIATRFSSAIRFRSTSSVLKKALELGIPGVRPFTDGDLLQRVSDDAAGLADSPKTIVNVVMGLVAAIGCVLALVFIHWSFVIVWMLGCFSIAVLVRSITLEISNLQLEHSERASKVVDDYVDAIKGRRTIRAAGTLDRERERITKPLGAIEKVKRKLLEAFGRGSVVLVSTSYGVLIASAGIGITLFALGNLEIGLVLAAIRYSQLAFAETTAVFDNGWFHIASHKVQASRLNEVDSAEVSIVEPVQPFHWNSTDSVTVALCGVTVKRDNRLILDNLTLCIPAGKSIALVGKSGVGKSTLTGLIGRLQDPDQGKVTLNNVPVNQLDRDTLSQVVSYAFERPSLLGDTIEETIALGHPICSEVLRSVTRQVEADAFISRLPLGYRTTLRDAPFSGGELQRIGLARAALKNTPVLILDDAMSSLDMATEARIARTLLDLALNRTTIVIAHRPNTAAAANSVVWLDQGQIREVAPHRYLWSMPEYRDAFAVIHHS